MKLPKGSIHLLLGSSENRKIILPQTSFSKLSLLRFFRNRPIFPAAKGTSSFQRGNPRIDEKALSHPIIVDEIQKLPILLNEVHWLIENSSAYFILCGSSARKLKAEGVNLLGGRAWRYEFFPLVYPEIKDFDLLHALNFGLIPSHFQAHNWSKTVKAYVNDYLKEEIKLEGLVRNLTAFAQFLDVAAFSNGETLNYSNIARDCAIDAKTIKEYYQVLVDTLLGYYIYPYKDKIKREDLVATPKFYFFDVGIINRLLKRTIPQLKGAQAGNAFEHYIFMELWAYRGLNDLEFDIHFWRTNSGLEVDFILGNAEIAIEVKITDHIKSSDIHGLIAFQKEYEPKTAIVVCTAPRQRKMTLPDGHTIDILPWRTFLESLWKGDIIPKSGVNS